MKQVRYHYRTRVTFSDAIRSHFFLLRCTPQQNDYQQVIREKCHVCPQENIRMAMDSLGNKMYSGFIEDRHNYFEFEVSGEVKLSGSYVLNEKLNRMYLYPSAYTQPDAAILGLLNAVPLNADNSVTGKIVKLSDTLYQLMEYSPQTTDIYTTASQALSIGKGVCQDYTHLLISLCRSAGIAARYVAGFIEGEGYTHAWVEYYDKGCWRAIDPTHNCLIETGYIKLSHGRDYDDCSIERGVFSGIVRQQLEVQLTVGVNDCQ